MFIHNMTQEAFKFCPNDPSITTKCWSGTPMKVFLAGLNPFSQHFTTFFFGDFWQNFSYFCSKKKKKNKIYIILTHVNLIIYNSLPDLEP